MDKKPFSRLLVPVNGSYVADAAFEFAARYAESTGALLSVLFVAVNQRASQLIPGNEFDHSGSDAYVQSMIRDTLMRKYKDKLKDPAQIEYVVRSGGDVFPAIVSELYAGGHDLLVIGAENKSLVEHLYLGQHVESLIDDAPCTVTVVIPKVQRALKSAAQN